MITLEHLTYSYPQQPGPALSGLNWQVTEGEFVLVAGPSGSGKSTLLRCLNGVVPHFTGGTLAGKIRVAGADPVADGPRVLSRKVGFVAQDPEAQAVLDRVEAEIAFALENAAISPVEMRVRVEEVLELLDLAPLRDRPIHKLSGGERQRLSIAAALALRPQILVLDEPTSQLDPQSADDVLRALVRLNEELALTIVLAEHRLERILPYADRITYLERGRIMADGPVREVIDRIPSVPPLIQLARSLGWQPTPLTVEEARPFVAFVNLEAPAREPSISPDSLPEADPLLEVEGLHFAYNGRRTLINVSLQVRSGEALALIGRNGAGKSTLLKCIIGLLRSQAGEVRVNGRSTRGRSVAEICLEVGYLPQNPDDLLLAETVIDELRETLRNHRVSEAPEYLAAQLETLGLGEVRDAYPRDLSVGQRQRVALGAVTVTRPRVLLLDEPTRGLDGATKEGLVALWRRWMDEGTAILLVTHDVELAGLLANRTVVFSEGGVIAAGATRDVLGSSRQFAPQIARLFPGRGWLTVADAITGLATAAQIRTVIP